MGQIVVENMGKAYKVYPSKLERLKEWLIPFSRQRHEYHWVLKGLNFEVKPGEAVGIIGINGAGKSTLLKMITGTTQPTTGNVNITGRVAALLELGMGFHPDFTGRQNVLMAGQLLGYNKSEIEELMPEIESFAEIGEYFDQPVRIYSSGMQMRLAFSVATAQRPDVLIVDEALSVGDAYFQHKSFDRIRNFREQGTTLLIVSHDKQAIQSICDRAILLNAGRLAMEGKPEAVMDFYNALLSDRENKTIQQNQTPTGKTQTTSGTGEASVEEVVLINSSGEVTQELALGEHVELQIKVHINQTVNSLVLGYSIKDRLGQVMYGTNTWHTKQVIHNVRAGENYLFKIAFPVNLGVGSYSIQTALVDKETHLGSNYDWRDLALVFNVFNLNHNHFIGSLWCEPMISVDKV